MTGFSIPFFVHQGLWYRWHLWAIHSFVVLLPWCSISGLIARHSKFCQRRLHVKCKRYSIYLRQSDVRAQEGNQGSMRKKPKQWDACISPLLYSQATSWFLSTACHPSHTLKVGTWDRLASWALRRLQCFCGVPAKSQIPNLLEKKCLTNKLRDSLQNVHLVPLFPPPPHTHTLPTWLLEKTKSEKLAKQKSKMISEPGFCFAKTNIIGTFGKVWVWHVD